MTTSRTTHKAADALDWNEAVNLIRRLYDDGKYRDSMMIACGCYLGLRISDILPLTWNDVVSDQISLKEKKTGKQRTLRINSTFRSHAETCRKAMKIIDGNQLVFSLADQDKPISRQAVDLILKKMKLDYRIKSAKVFSAHSLRKTFGRRVWLQECDRGRGEQALVLLQDVFGHSSVAITRRYLGIRQDEILSVYDSLD